MSIHEHLELGARLKQCVVNDDHESFRETITQICALLDIPTVGSPESVDREAPARALIDLSAELILGQKNPEPASLCAELLFCSIAPGLIFGDSMIQLSPVEYALVLAGRGTRRATLRRALNTSSVVALEAGE